MKEALLDKIEKIKTARKDLEVLEATSALVWEDIADARSLLKGKVIFAESATTLANDQRCILGDLEQRLLEMI